MIYNLGEMNGKITYTGIKDEYKKYMVYGGEATLVNEGYETGILYCLRQRKTSI